MYLIQSARAPDLTSCSDYGSPRYRFFTSFYSEFTKDNEQTRRDILRRELRSALPTKNSLHTGIPRFQAVMIGTWYHFVPNKHLSREGWRDGQQIRFNSGGLCLARVGMR